MEYGVSGVYTKVLDGLVAGHGSHGMLLGQLISLPSTSRASTYRTAAMIWSICSWWRLPPVFLCDCFASAAAAVIAIYWGDSNLTAKVGAS